MTTTFDDRISGPEGQDLRLYFTVQGVPNVFQEDSVDVPTTLEAAGRPRTKRVVRIEQAQSRLDLVERRMVGGSLTIRLVDDDAGTLRALFVMRKRKTTFLRSPATAATGTLNTKLSTSLPASGTVYVDAETISYTGNAANNLTGCTRALYGSEALPHSGTSSDGAGVFTSPPSWLGRRVYLWGYFVNDDGTTTAALSKQLDTFRLEAAPIYLGDNQWELRCSHLSDEFAAAKLGEGIVDVPLAQKWETSSSTELTFYPADKGQRLLLTAGTNRTYARIEWEEGVMVARNIGHGGAATTFKTAWESLSVGPFVRGSPKSARHFVYSQSAPGVFVLEALCSRLGDGANGAYDDLPGLAPAFNGSQTFRMGAGIRAGEVDDAAWAALPHAGPWSYVIDEELSVAEFLRDVCLSTASIWYVTRAGQLSVRRIGEVKQATVLALTDRHLVGQPQLTYREEELAPRVRLKCNYDVVTREHEKTLTLVDVALARRYPTREDTLEIESRAIVIAPVDVGGDDGTLVRDAHSQSSAEAMLRRIQVSSARGRASVQARLTNIGLRLQLGDVVTLTTALPDLEGAASIDGRKCRVVAWQPNYDDMTVDVELDYLDPLTFVAPACVIASAVGATLTLRTTGPEVTSVNPATDLFVGGDVWVADVVDVSAGVRERISIQSVTAPSTLVLGAAPTFAIQAGVDYVTVGPGGPTSTASTATNGEGYQISEFIFAQEDDESGVLGSPAADNPVSRWR